MKRDRKGKFVRNWDCETKQRVSITLTATAWQLLDEEAQKRGISRSEVIERAARSFNEDKLQKSPQPNDQNLSGLLVGEKICRELILEEALAKQTAILQEQTQLLDLSMDAIFVRDLEHKITFWNQGAQQLYGWTQEQVLGNSPHVLLQTQFPQPIAAIESEFFNIGHWQGELVLQGRDGTTVIVMSRWLLKRDAIGQPVAILEVNHDITARKQAEIATKQANERFELVAAAVNSAIYDWDLLRNQIERTENMTRLFGYSLEEMEPTNKWWLDRIHPDDIQRVKNALTESLLHSDRFNLEYRIRNKQDGYSYVADQGLIVRDNTGRAIRVMGSTLNISEKKQVEAALRQSEERYRYLAELIPQLVWIANAQGVLLDVNQRWCEFTGLTLLQAQTEGWEAVVHPDDVPILAHYWVEAQQNATCYQAEGRMRRTDGTYRWHLHQALPLKDEQGQVIKWFGTATDIEDQKQIEQQRTLILQQEQKAREAAEKANRIKDEFLAVLSHELRSPLNPILGWAKLLQTRKFAQTDINTALATIERNAKLQVQLIDDLLDVSRILQGKLNLNIAPVNLVAVIEAAIETVRLAAEAKDIQIQTMLDSSVGQVLGDSSRLQQVVWNLLTNAVKFTPEGGKVNIQVECIDTQAQITVSDTGRGISPDFLPHVFEYFRQADSTTTRKFGGLGLGLAIVHHLVELHGGTVWAESPGIGQGATFTVRLPLVKKDLTSASATNTLASKTSPSTSILIGIQILVVDDDADSCDFHTFVLEQVGASVTAVASAKEALQVLVESPPDILLSDIGLPEMDGYMLMRQVKALQTAQKRQIPAIALTAYAGEINQRQALSAGYQMHLAKPVEPEELVKAIVTLTQRSDG
jgi:PAS domain S-box-containing protein